MTTLYQYDSVTYEYTGSYEPQRNPADPANPLIRPRSTDKKPLNAGAGRVNVWSGSAWASKEDHRGSVVWSTSDGASSKVDYIGEISEEFTDKDPSGVEFSEWSGSGWVTDAERKAESDYIQWKAGRERLVSEITVEVDGMVFDGNEVAQARMSRAVLFAQSDDEPTEWTLADNSVVEVTAGTLRTAGRLAGIAMSELWNKDRP